MRWGTVATMVATIVVTLQLWDIDTVLAAAWLGSRVIATQLCSSTYRAALLYSSAPRPFHMPSGHTEVDLNSMYTLVGLLLLQIHRVSVAVVLIRLNVYRSHVVYATVNV